MVHWATKGALEEFPAGEVKGEGESEEEKGQRGTERGSVRRFHQAGEGEEEKIFEHKCSATTLQDEQVQFVHHVCSTTNCSLSLNESVLGEGVGRHSSLEQDDLAALVE